MGWCDINKASLFLSLEDEKDDKKDTEEKEDKKDNDDKAEDTKDTDKTKEDVKDDKDKKEEKEEESDTENKDDGGSTTDDLPSTDTETPDNNDSGDDSFDLDKGLDDSTGDGNNTGDMDTGSSSDIDPDNPTGEVIPEEPKEDLASINNTNILIKMFKESKLKDETEIPLTGIKELQENSDYIVSLLSLQSTGNHGKKVNNNVITAMQEIFHPAQPASLVGIANNLTTYLEEVIEIYSSEYRLKQFEDIKEVIEDHLESLSYSSKYFTVTKLSNPYFFFNKNQEDKWLVYDFDKENYKFIEYKDPVMIEPDTLNKSKDECDKWVIVVKDFKTYLDELMQYDKSAIKNCIETSHYFKSIVARFKDRVPKEISDLLLPIADASIEEFNYLVELRRDVINIILKFAITNGKAYEEKAEKDKQEKVEQEKARQARKNKQKSDDGDDGMGMDDMDMDMPDMDL